MKKNERLKKILLSIAFLLLTFATCYQVAAQKVQVVVIPSPDDPGATLDGTYASEKFYLNGDVTLGQAFGVGVYLINSERNSEGKSFFAQDITDYNIVKCNPNSDPEPVFFADPDDIKLNDLSTGEGYLIIYAFDRGNDFTDEYWSGKFVELDQSFLELIDGESDEEEDITITVIFPGTDGFNHVCSEEAFPEQTILDFLSSLPDNPCGEPLNLQFFIGGKPVDPSLTFGEYPELFQSDTVLQVFTSQEGSAIQVPSVPSKEDSEEQQVVPLQKPPTMLLAVKFLEVISSAPDNPGALLSKRTANEVMRLYDLQQVRMESSPKRFRRLASKTTSEQENPTQGSDSQLGQTTITQPGVGEVSVDPLPAPW